MIRAWHTSPFIKIAKRRITAAEPRSRQLMYALYIRVAASVALSCSSSVYRLDEPCKSSMPIAQISIHPEPANSHAFSTLGLSFSGCFRVMHRFSDLMSHSNSMLSGKQLRQSHAPVNSCIVYTLGLSLAWLFLVLHPFIDLMTRVKVQCNRTNFHSSRACQLTYVQYARVIILGVLSLYKKTLAK